MSFNQAALCGVCQQHPKNGRHPYCSKTCAAQAATLCNHCFQKPKFGNHDFCGRYCASENAKQGGGSGIGGIFSQMLGKGSGKTPHAGGNRTQHTVLSPAARPGPSARYSGSPSQPQVILVQTQSTRPGNVRPQAPRPSPQRWSQSQSPIEQPRNKQLSNTSLPTCGIPGCRKPVFVKDGMIASDYCSNKHAREATQGASNASTSGGRDHGQGATFDDVYDSQDLCIMCSLALQSSSDYFCGESCRAAAMMKKS